MSEWLFGWKVAPVHNITESHDSHVILKTPHDIHVTLTASHDSHVTLTASHDSHMTLLQHHTRTTETGLLPLFCIRRLATLHTIVT